MGKALTKSDTDWSSTLLGEILLLGVLSKALKTYPERDWIEALIGEDIFLEAPLGDDHPDIQAGLFLLRSWSKTGQKELPQDEIDALEIDHTKLFIGTGEVLAPPWESVYFSEDRLIFQEQTLQVRKWYRRYGLEPELLHREPDDHIALEIAFISHLSKLAFEALRAGHKVKSDEYLNAQRQFLSEHLLKWGPQWCVLVIENAQTDFYKGLAYLTRGALLFLADLFNVPVSREALK